jgi:hypothetical protein
MKKEKKKRKELILKTDENLCLKRFKNQTKNMSKLQNNTNENITRFSEILNLTETY